MPLRFYTLSLTSAKNASALNEIERKRQCQFCLCCRLLAITGDVAFTNPFLVVTVRFSSENICLDDVVERSFRKEFNELNIFMYKYCV